MEKLIGIVQEKTGLSEENSRKAAEVVVEYIKSKLPDAIASHVDSVLGDDSDGEEGDGDIMDKVKGGLSSLF